MLKKLGYLTFGVLISFSMVSHAEDSNEPAFTSSIVEGRYEDTETDPGTKKDRGSHELFIKSVDDGYGGKTHFALIRWAANYTSLYRIEEIDEVTQAWVPLYLGSDNVIRTPENQQAIYAVTQLRTENGLQLKFAWTSMASEYGANISCSLLPQFTYDPDGKQWGDISAIGNATLNGKRVREKQFVGQEYSRRHRQYIKKFERVKYRAMEAILTPMPSSGQVNITANNVVAETQFSTEYTKKDENKNPLYTNKPIHETFNGNFVGYEQVPGLMLFKQKSLDSTVASGLRLSDNVSFVVVPYVDRKKRLENLEIIRMAPGVKECAYPRANLE